MSDQKQPNIIIDNGSGYIKAGFSGTDAPSAYFPSVVGVPKHPGIMVGAPSSGYFVGNLAIEKKGVLKLTYAVEHGIVENWDMMEQIWSHCFNNELNVDPKEFNVMLTEAPQNPLANREKMTQIMFDSFNVKGFYVAIQAVLSLYSNGKFTGIVFDSGDGVTHLVPIFEGFALPHCIRRIDVAGRELNTYKNSFSKEVLSSTPQLKRKLLRTSKKKLVTLPLTSKLRRRNTPLEESPIKLITCPMAPLSLLEMKPSDAARPYSDPPTLE
jgi:actin